MAKKHVIGKCHKNDTIRTFCTIEWLYFIPTINDVNSQDDRWLGAVISVKKTEGVKTSFFLSYSLIIVNYTAEWVPSMCHPTPSKNSIIIYLRNIIGFLLYNIYLHIYLFLTQDEN